MKTAKEILIDAGFPLATFSSTTQYNVVIAIMEEYAKQMCEFQISQLKESAKVLSSVELEKAQSSQSEQASEQLGDKIKTLIDDYINSDGDEDFDLCVSKICTLFRSQKESDGIECDSSCQFYEMNGRGICCKTWRESDVVCKVCKEPLNEANGDIIEIGVCSGCNTNNA